MGRWEGPYNLQEKRISLTLCKRLLCICQGVVKIATPCSTILHHLLRHSKKNDASHFIPGVSQREAQLSSGSRMEANTHDQESPLNLACKFDSFQHQLGGIACVELQSSATQPGADLQFKSRAANNVTYKWQYSCSLKRASEILTFRAAKGPISE